MTSHPSSQLGWACPRCGRVWSPYVDYCGGCQFRDMAKPQASNGCSACGLKLDGVLNYVCHNPSCPCGLAGPTC